MSHLSYGYESRLPTGEKITARLVYDYRTWEYQTSYVLLSNRLHLQSDLLNGTTHMNMR
jgi:hypothetical protein